MSNVYNCTDGGFSCTTGNITSGTTVSFQGSFNMARINGYYQCPGPGSDHPNTAECQEGFDQSSTYSNSQGCIVNTGFENIPNPPVPPNAIIGGGNFLGNYPIFCPPSTARYLCQNDMIPMPSNISQVGSLTSPNSINNNGTLNYQCNYSIESLIDTANNSLIAGIAQQALSQQAMQQVYAYYCSLQAPSTQSCPIGPLTTVPGSNIQGVSMTSCSNMLASNSPAMIQRGYQSCQDYFSQSNGHNTCYNASIQSYCGIYPGASDCQCVNYQNNTLFESTSSGTAARLAVIPTCWWAPCQAPNNSLIPRCVTSGPFTPANNLQCPNTQCVEIIQNNIVGGNLNNNPTQQCSSTTNNIPPSPVVTNNTTNTTNTTGGTTTTTMTKGISKEDSKIAAGIIVGVIILIALVVGGFILYELLHKK